jgi:cysteine desulfurase
MWAKNVRYLDYNASSGVTVAVRKKLTEILSRSDFYFSNPSSQHSLGQQSRQLLLKAEMKIAASLGKNVDSSQLVFTASGTEANQTVIRSAMKMAEVMIIGAGEHSASYDLLSEVPKEIRAHELPLQKNGQYDLNELARILADAKQSGCTKIFLSLFWANNETGVLTPLKELESVLHSSGLTVLLHLDGAQAWGKLELDLHQTPAHYITFSGHKIGAPAGAGVIWIRQGTKLIPLVSGSQSKGLRGGTENILAIAALSYATEELDLVSFTERTSSLRNRLEEGLRKLPVKIWAEETSRIPNTCRFSVLGFKGYENWVQLFDLRGFAVSHGSACKSSVVQPSRVLLKMGASESEALNAIRISFGSDIEPIDVDEFLIAFQAILEDKTGQS